MLPDEPIDRDVVGPMVPAEEAGVVRPHIEERRERAANLLAGGLMLIFGLTVLLPLLWWVWYRQAPPPEILTYVKDIAGLETTLLGATAAFYFSQRRLGGR